VLVLVDNHALYLRAFWQANVAVKQGALEFTAGEDQKAADVKKGKKAKGTENSVAADSLDGGKRLDVLRCLVAATLRRSSAFSALLLGEAVRLLPLSAAVLLLRVVTYFMRALSGADAKDAAAATSDEQMKRAATWAEALLDGHFSALALHAVSHPATRRALTCAMEAISGAEEASEQVQSALGLWTHISRVIHNGGQQVKPITSLYQVEHLDLR
jgi:hypothetical protein